MMPDKTTLGISDKTSLEFSDKTTLGISDTLREFIEALVEEVVLESKPFDEQKKRLCKYSEAEGVDYETLESNLFRLFEIAEELKSIKSKVLEVLLVITAQECFLSSEKTQEIIGQIADIRTAAGAGEPPEEASYKKVSSEWTEWNYEKAKAIENANSAQKKREQVEKQLQDEQESLEETKRTADSKATIKMENDLKAFKDKKDKSIQREKDLRIKLDVTVQQENTERQVLNEIINIEKQKTKKAIWITCIAVAASFAALLIVYFSIK